MRIYLPPESIGKKIGIVLPPDKARHVASVMRCKTGDELTVIDGCGKTYLASISGIQGRSVSIDIIQEVAPDSESSESQFDFVLCQGILKGEKMDSVIQKATELGINTIVPLISGRCQVRETRKMERWRKIAEEAAEQCGRSVVPEIDDPRTFEDFIKIFIPAEPPQGIIFWEGGGLAPDEAFEKASISNKKPFFLFIGPEGGFMPSELGLTDLCGFIRATLGTRILRADTAAVAALVLVQFFAEKNKTADKV